MGKIERSFFRKRRKASTLRVKTGGEGLFWETEASLFAEKKLRREKMVVARKSKVRIPRKRTPHESIYGG